MKHFFFDFETCPIQPYVQAPPIVCMSYVIDDGKPEVLHTRDSKMWRVLWSAISSDAVMVAHNAPFEFSCILAVQPGWRDALFAKLDRDQIVCTEIRDRLIHIGHHGGLKREYGLDACMATWGLTPPDKGEWWRANYGLLVNTPVELWTSEAYDYSLGDTCIRELFWAQDKVGPEYLVDQFHQTRAYVALKMMSCWGIQTDPEAAQKLVEDTKLELAQDQELLAATGLLWPKKEKGVWRLSRDTGTAAEYLTKAYEALGRDVPRGEVTEKAALKGQTLGNIKLDEDACVASQDDLLLAYTRYGQANTLLNKAKRLTKPILQPSFVPILATGRTACRQGDDPKPGEPWMAWGTQVQNPPRKAGVRECMVARPGHCLLSIDFDTCELRTHAQVNFWEFGFSDMMEVLHDPSRDVHAEQGAMIADVSSDVMYGWKKDKDPRYKHYRQMGKMVVFGAPGGLGPDSMVDYAWSSFGERITRETAEQLLWAWKRRWREMPLYLEWVSSLVGKRGSRIQIKHFQSNRLRGQTGFCDTANSFFQGLAADAAKRGICAVCRAIYTAKPGDLAYGCRVVAYIHDEILVEVPMELMHERAHYLRDLFVSAAQVLLPDVRLTASPSAMYRWTKAASDPVYVDGKLICWEDRPK